MSTIKSLIHHGNSLALVIDKALLVAAGLNAENALFQITVSPGEIVIQSVKGVDENLHKKAFRDVLKENDALMKRLADR